MPIKHELFGKVINIFTPQPREGQQPRAKVQIMSTPHDLSSEGYELNTYNLPKSYVPQLREQYMDKTFMVSLSQFTMDNGRSGFYIKSLEDMRIVQEQKQAK